MSCLWCIFCQAWEPPRSSAGYRCRREGQGVECLSNPITRMPLTRVRTALSSGGLLPASLWPGQEFSAAAGENKATVPRNHRAPSPPSLLTVCVHARAVAPLPSMHRRQCWVGALASFGKWGLFSFPIKIFLKKPSEPTHHPHVVLLCWKPQQTSALPTPLRPAVKSPCNWQRWPGCHHTQSWRRYMGQTPQPLLGSTLGCPPLRLEGWCCHPHAAGNVTRELGRSDRVRTHSLFMPWLRLVSGPRSLFVSGWVGSW